VEESQRMLGGISCEKVCVTLGEVEVDPLVCRGELSMSSISRADREEKRVGHIIFTLPEKVSSPESVSSSGKPGKCRCECIGGESEEEASSSIVSSKMSSSGAPVQVFLKCLVYLQSEHLKGIPI